MPTTTLRALNLPVLIFALLASGCAKPVVEVDNETGQKGMFCVSEQDCGPGLSCLEQSCCANPDCSASCASLLEKVQDPAGSHHPMLDRFLRRKCIAKCCEGADAAQIERTLRAWARQVPDHTIQPSPDDPGPP